MEDLVTCDTCDATSEAGWGDTPNCSDCTLEGKAEGEVCSEHGQTFYTGEDCNVCIALS